MHRPAADFGGPRNRVPLSGLSQRADHLHSAGVEVNVAAGECGQLAAVREARDALKMRYARGEIGREEYLQGKVELED